MFGILKSAASFAANTAIDTVTAPVRAAANVLDIADGLTEGEIRVEAVKDLGYEVVSNMTQCELLDWYKGAS